VLLVEYIESRLGQSIVVNLLRRPSVIEHDCGRNLTCRKR
jgi:hypothetical protein